MALVPGLVFSKPSVSTLLLVRQVKHGDVDTPHKTHKRSDYSSLGTSFLVACLQVKSIVSYNHLGNNDGKNRECSPHSHSHLWL
jgi:hypothetical protein